jgi:hypothetical protein
VELSDECQILKIPFFLSKNIPTNASIFISFHSEFTILVTHHMTAGSLSFCGKD